jgi:L-fuconolactonase
VIDAHQHFWTFDPVRDAWITKEMQVLRRDYLPKDLAPELEKAGVMGTIAVQADESAAETRFLLDLAEQHSFIKGVVGWADLSAPDLLEQLAAYRAEPALRGFRVITQGKPVEQYFGNKVFAQGLKALAAQGFTYDLLIYHHQFPEAIRCMEQCPDLGVMLDHLGKPAIGAGEIKKWKEQVRILAANPNVYCKLSGMVTEADWKRWRYEDFAPYFEIAGEFFGTHRLCFGSDWPVCLLAGSYTQVSGILHRFLEQVRPEERADVWGGNAISFYGITLPAVETGSNSPGETFGID